MHGLALFLAIYTQAEITRLGNDAWHERETASQRLAAIMPMADHALSQVAGDPERIIRARRIREHWVEKQDWWYYQRAKWLRAPGFNLTPWIDSLPDDKVERGFWLAEAGRHPDLWKLPPRQYEQYRLATVLWMASQLKHGMSEAAIIEVLVEGAEYETTWLEANAKTEKWAEVLREAKKP